MHFGLGTPTLFNFLSLSLPLKKRMSSIYTSKKAVKTFCTILHL